MGVGWAGGGWGWSGDGIDWSGLGMRWVEVRMGWVGLRVEKNQIILIEGSHTLTSDVDTNPSRLGKAGVLQCQISLPITASNASI